MNIPFSPPNLLDSDIQEVVSVLRSGWITTGPKTKAFEEALADYMSTKKVICLNSATAGLELILRILGIGPGDEIITSAYTYTASASVIHHVGATPVLVDIVESTYQLDPKKLSKAISNRTKAIITVDLAGILCDYDQINRIAEEKSYLYQPHTTYQEMFTKVPIIADASHALGATLHEKPCGTLADFTVFSFHAVKNLTTGEGGAITWKKNEAIDDEKLYQIFHMYSLHGQTKDAFNKNQHNNWEYDILYPAYKYNMTDIAAALGISQLRRYPASLNLRKNIVTYYNSRFLNSNVEFLPHLQEDATSSYHLYMLRLNGYREKERNELIQQLAAEQIATNVHYKPLPLLTAYRNLGFNIEDFPCAYSAYEKEITLPLYQTLTEEACDYICTRLLSHINS